MNKPRNRKQNSQSYTNKKTQISPKKYSHKWIFKRAFQRFIKSNWLKKTLNLLPILISFIIPYLLKTPKPLYWGFGGFAAYIAYLFAYYYALEYNFKSNPTFFIGISFIVSIVTIYFIVRIITNENESNLAVKFNPCNNPQTLYDFYKCDFDNYAGYLSHEDFQVLPHKEIFDCSVKLLLDFPARSYFMSFYVPNTPLTFEICQLICTFCDTMSNDYNSRTEIEYGNEFIPDRHTEFKDLKFSKRIYIYHPYLLTQSEIDKLVQIFKTQDLSVIFRSEEYVRGKKNQKNDFIKK